MNRKHALALAAAAFLSAPVFAQTVCDASGLNCTTTTILGAGPVLSSSNTVVGSGTGVIVTPGAPAAVVAVAPGTRVLPGAAQIQASQTTVMGGPAPGIASTTTVVTNYWTNVPAGAEHRADFQRWLHLKP